MARTILERFESKFTKSEGCWEWETYKDRGGYGQFGIAERQLKAHRVAYQLYVGAIPVGLCVCHRCDNPGCVNPGHLFLGTIADNMRDCNNKGRRMQPDNSGEKNGRSKLTAAQVVEIRTLYGDGATQSEIAKEFGVRRTTISMIVLRQIWTSI